MVVVDVNGTVVVLGTNVFILVDVVAYLVVVLGPCAGVLENILVVEVIG